MTRPMRGGGACFFLIAAMLSAGPAWGWGVQGHQIVALIAADNLTPAARNHVAHLLGVPNEPVAVANEMAYASMRPDVEFKEEDPATKPWHYVDLCLQDHRGDIDARCPRGDCVTAKIDQFSERLKRGYYDKWGAAGDLAFLIHLVGDVHQPMHAITNADKGGNCIRVSWRSRVDNLHAVWDSAVVSRFEQNWGVREPHGAAEKLEQIYANEKDREVWKAGAADQIAWESNRIARTDIYDALHIPVEACEPEVISCANAPAGVIHLDSSYMDRESVVAGHQLAKAGFRLAGLLNTMWVSPVSAAEAAHEVPNPSAAGVTKGPAAQSVSGPVVGNRRSRIYAWPQCRSYDKMEPHNRVIFPTREAAEGAGYRPARDCR